MDAIIKEQRAVRTGANGRVNNASGPITDAVTVTTHVTNNANMLNDQEQEQELTRRIIKNAFF